jgi:sugar lactone lactonase YvrE
MNFAPKLVVYNLDSGNVLRTFVFPNDVAPYNSSFLNDIVVDEINHVAYISDTGVVGGIIVYDWTTNSARRWGGDVTQQHDPTYTVTINGVEYPTVRNNADGIALSTDLQTLYYCVVDGNHLFSIPTKYLRDFTTTDDFLHSQLTVVGQKMSASDGMAVDSSGKLYFGSFSNSAVVSWDPSTPLSPQTQTIVCSDAEQMQWQDTFAFDNQGNLFFTTNRLQAYFLVG